MAEKYEQMEFDVREEAERELREKIDLAISSTLSGPTSGSWTPTTRRPSRRRTPSSDPRRRWPTRRSGWPRTLTG